jgi:hypothetical protein
LGRGITKDAGLILSVLIVLASAMPAFAQAQNSGAKPFNIYSFLTGFALAALAWFAKDLLAPYLRDLWKQEQKKKQARQREDEPVIRLIVAALESEIDLVKHLWLTGRYVKSLNDWKNSYDKLFERINTAEVSRAFGPVFKVLHDAVEDERRFVVPFYNDHGEGVENAEGTGVPARYIGTLISTVQGVVYRYADVLNALGYSEEADTWRRTIMNETQNVEWKNEKGVWVYLNDRNVVTVAKRNSNKH